MRLRHIEVFHAVYSSKSISNAARLLNVSQPSVSKVLRHAEDQLGYLLFERMKGKLIPTQEARQLYQEVSKFYTNLDGIRRLAENLAHAEKGVIRIAMTPALGLKVIPQAVAEFLEKHPGIRFDIETLHHGEIIKSLLEHKIDLGIAFDPSPHPDIQEKVIATGEFVCLAPENDPMPDGERVSLSELEGRDFIGLNGRSPLGRLLRSQVDTGGANLNTIANVETYHIAKTMVSMGAGIAIVDEITARSNMTEAVQVKKMMPAVRFGVTALLLKDEPVSLMCQEFLSHIEKVLGGFLKGDLTVSL